ncbi:MAG: ATP-binding protein [bacterium]|nr:ATP-binding protein [bacterium]
MIVHSLSARIFALIASVSLVGMAFLSWAVVRMHTADLEAATIVGGVRLSDALLRSTRVGMLQNRKADVYEAIRQVGGQKGIERIRIYNKKGAVVFSTVDNERGHIVDKDAEACTRCHRSSGETVARPPQGELTRIFAGAEGSRILGLITPVYSEPACAAAGCHPPVAQQQILGVIDMQISLADIDRATNAQTEHFQVQVYVLMLLVAALCGLFVWRFVHRPVQDLIHGTERLRAGQLDYRIPVRGQSETGRLAASFNEMSAELAAANRQLTEWAHTLEARVEDKTRSLQQAQTKIVHSEKMASLGTLSAVVAHEINNPLSGVLTYAKLVRRLLQDGKGGARKEDLDTYLSTMIHETKRCGMIVRNLLEFSRQTGLPVGAANLNEIIERTLFLIGHKLELQQITLQRTLSPELPRVTCDPEQIQQALLALLMNAVEAMPEGGTLTVASESVDPGTVSVTIADTGGGIAAEVQPRIFEPFFTTKQDKHGVGLGLSVVYGIVQRHRGDIGVDSSARGTRFTLTLPVRAELEDRLLQQQPMEQDDVVPVGVLPDGIDRGGEGSDG